MIPITLKLHLKQTLTWVSEEEIEELAENLLEFLTPKGIRLLNNNTLAFIANRFMVGDAAPVETVLVPICAITNIDDTSMQIRYGKELFDAVNFTLNSHDPSMAVLVRH